VGFGVESGNQAVLDSIKKRQTLDDVRRAFREAKAAGLQTMGFFIFGLPADTEESMEDTIRFALELDPDLANFMIAAPYPGTELWEIARRDGGCSAWTGAIMPSTTKRLATSCRRCPRAGGAQVARGLPALLPAARSHLAPGHESLTPGAGCRRPSQLWPVLSSGATRGGG
jgi:hypothetical protein